VKNRACLITVDSGVSFLLLIIWNTPKLSATSVTTIPELVCVLLVYIWSIRVAELDANLVGNVMTDEKPNENMDFK
jgi:hypothetical protein